MSRSKMKQLEQEYGTLEEIIPRMVNEGGQKMAAVALGVSQSTISVWLKDNGYEPIIVYRKSESGAKVL